MGIIKSLQCTRCGQELPADRVQTVCPKDGGVLYARYDLAEIKKTFKREALQGRTESMWRYREVLPAAEPVTLGEGWTPIIPARRNSNVLIKDEGVNPTGSFKARGLCMAVTMAKHFGLKDLAIPSAGNAAGALAGYCAAAGLKAHIFMPKDVPAANLMECTAYGADVHLVDGLISDCGRMVAERKDKEGWFEISTLKEPYRVEGKKTMGYEVAEQLGWELPDAIFYPTGGGVGLLGMWKAFEEMEALGWIGKKRPKMVVVQAAGCAPIPKAWEEGKAASEPWQNAHTIAAGLRVPKAYGDYIILDILKHSGGTAVSVSDQEMLQATREWAEKDAFLACPEGAAAFAAYEKLIASSFLRSSDQVVIFNTGSAYKYTDVLVAGLGLGAREARSSSSLPKGRNIGGIIQPY